MGFFDEFYEKIRNLLGENADVVKKKDYYELLEITSTATDDEIKKSYRRLALKWHPDKNIGKEEECRAYFQLLQQAYDVLSDPRERAFYDKHKDNILRDEDPNEEHKDEGLELFQFFRPCYRGYGDDAQGFYSIYRTVFDTLSTEEYPYLDEDDREFPTFGRSDSDYDMIVGPFYDFWTNFSTKRTFAWLDKWNLRDAPNRQVLRAMEKDNRKLREGAQRERNDEIRSLAAYLRKRDKRVQAFRATLEERRIKELQRVEEERLRRLREDRLNIEDHVEDEAVIEQRVRDLEEIENALDAQFGTVGEQEAGSEDGEEYGTACVVCDKVFKTEKAYQNHQKSKKHKQAVDELKRHMKEEDALFLDSEINDPEDDDNTPVANGNGNRQGKKKKRRNRREKSPDANDDDAVENPVSSTPDELADGVAEIRIDDDANSEEVQPPVETTPVESVPAKAQKSKKKTKGTPAPPPPKKGPTVPIESICKVCGLDFDSRSKLFKHIEATGHAALKTDVPANAPKSGKKKGRK